MSGANDPFACFGDSSSSDGSDRDEDPATVDPSPAAAANLEEAHRLKERSNGDRSVVITPVENDSSYEVFDAGPFSGKGLRATAAHGCGDEILREDAVMRIPNSQPASSAEAAREMHRRAVQRAYNSMHPETRAAFMDLSSCDESFDDRTPRGVYDTNSFRLGNEDDGGLFLAIARINHSCRPNVNHFWREDLQKTLIFATRDIRVGEELYTTYGPSECMSTRDRREYLSDRFSFRCMCEMCVEGNARGGDDRMVEIKSLQEDIALSSSTTLATTAAAVLDSVKKSLALMNEQGIGGGVFLKSIYHQGYDVCMAAGDDEGARSYLVRELKAVQDSEGVDSPRAIEIEWALMNA